jgi:hypothetical protein
MNVPPVRSVVELRPGLEDLYSGAKAGWRGVVKGHKVDEGYDLIYIEWDRDYWRYDPTVDQPDGWTYPSHFEVVDQLAATPEQFAAEMIHRAEHDAERGMACEHCRTKHEPRDEYLEVLHDAAAQAAQGEGFALFFVQREDEGDNFRVYPSVVSACLTDEAAALIEAQVVQIAQNAIEKYMIDHLKKFT